MPPTIQEHDVQRAYIIWALGLLRPDGLWKPERALLPGVLCWSVPNGGFRDPREAKRLKEEGLLAGVPDVHHLWGALYCLEFKKPGGTQPPERQLSLAQRDLHPQFRAAGAHVATVDTLAGAKAQIIAWGLARSC